MKIIYAEKSTGIDEDGSFQNPKYFERADKQATSVVIYGDYPEIEEAYKGLGVEVEVREVVKKPLKANDDLEKLQAKLTETETQLGALQAENTELKAKIEELEKLAAKKPTPAELRAAKAAEQTKALEQEQE